jgi:endo-1,4-beta-xylanase
MWGFQTSGIFGNVSMKNLELLLRNTVKTLSQCRTKYHNTNQMRKIYQIVCLTVFLTLFFKIGEAQTTVQTNVPALKEVFANDFSIGCLLSYPHIGFPNDPYVSGQGSIVAPQGGYLIKHHMNCMTPGNNMKSIYTIDIAASASAYKAATTQEARDSIEINPKVRFNGNLIAQLNWAKRQGFAFRGHTLVWHSQSPAEFFRSGYTATGTRVSKEVMTKRMENYIKEVIRILHESWPNMLVAMDVVNEAISDSNGAFRTSGNEWYTTFGDNSYVMKAFELARKYTLEYGETQMKLYYNDYNTHSSTKATGIANLCKPIFEAGYLDGIGMQDHDSNTSPTAAQWIASYNKFYPVCHEMAVTELDVSTNSGTNSPSAAVLTTQANQYAQLFKCFVERSYYSGRGKLINVSKDGLNDQYTFVTNQSSSLWNTNNQCKPAFYAVVDVGIYYNKLDSLIKVANALDKNEFTSTSWSIISAELSSAKTVLAKNFSSSDPAATGLANAYNNLQKSISAGRGVNDLSKNISVKTYDGKIHIYGAPVGAVIHIYNLNGALLQSEKASEPNPVFSYISPCIVRISDGRKTFTSKFFQQ